jgi:SRSO17 transposase
MTANEILALRPRIERFLRLFDECFVDDGTRHHLRVYVQGQLSNLPRKSVEPIAVAADMAPKTLQQFLTLAKWDHLLMRDRLQQRVASRHRGPHVIGVFDETGCPKKGHKTPGVQHQYCGASGKNDNCIVTVHLALAEGSFHCLLDSELFLPEVWSADRSRCRSAGIPEALVHRPKWQIGLELYDIARGNGLAFAWVTFDEGYGGKPGFLRGLIARGQRFVGEVPGSLTGWIERPAVTCRPYRKGGRSRPRKVPRLVSGSPRALSLRDHLSGPALDTQPWRASHVKDTEKGPMVWEAKRATITLKDEDDLPGMMLELVVARDVTDRDKTKFFVSPVAREMPTEPLLLAGLTRWHVERCFEDSKTELGFDHWEGRSYLGLMRHQIISAVSLLLLAEVRRELRGEKPGVDRLPGPGRRSRGNRGLNVGSASRTEVGPARRTVDQSSAAGELRSA